MHVCLLCVLLIKHCYSTAQFKLDRTCMQHGLDTTCFSFHMRASMRVHARLMMSNLPCIAHVRTRRLHDAHVPHDMFFIHMRASMRVHARLMMSNLPCIAHVRTRRLHDAHVPHDMFFIHMRASMRVHARLLMSNLPCIAHVCTRRVHDAHVHVRNAHAKFGLRVYANCKPRTAE